MTDDPSTKDASGGQRDLRARYVIALAIIAVLSIGSHMAITTTVATQDGNGAQINVSSTQRVLSQRIALNANAMAQGDSIRAATARETLESLVIQMGQAHDNLINGNEREGLPGDPNDELTEIYFGSGQLDVKVRSFLVTAQNFLDTPQERITINSTPVLSLTGLAADPSDSGLLATLARASQAYSDDSDREVDSVVTVAQIVLAVTLIALVIEGRWVFRPMIRRITEQTESILRARSRLRAVLDNALVGVITLDESGTIIDANATAKGLLALDVDALDGASLADFTTSADGRAALRELVEQARLGTDPTPLEIELSRSDDVFLARISARVGDSADGRFISAVITDETVRRQAEDDLRHNADHDALTDLPNRALFKRRVDAALDTDLRSIGTATVMFIDLDDFKTINDSLGHLVGDQLLTVVAQRLSSCVRAGDTAARLGGDEFAVLIPDALDSSIAQRMAERITGVLRTPIVINGVSLSMTASIGIAVADRAEDSTALLSNADNAMYSAKRLGKDKFCYFTPELHDQAVDRLDLKVGMTQALRSDQFALHYQPIVDLDDGEILGVEALIRWDHPERGRVAPDQFIPVAEETGQIVPIGWWVLERAVSDAVEFRERFGERAPGYVSVNVSPLQFTADDFVDRLRALLHDRLPGSALVLELTETALALDSAAVAATLVRVRALGVRIAIDDFGTGYSALSYLHSLTVDILKIDRSFVSQITDGSDGSPLVASMLQMAKALGLDVIAEGVETDEQRLSLLGMSCEVAQGYHFAKPADFASTCALLEAPLAVSTR